MSQHGLGWIPDVPDQRDFPYKQTARSALPKEIDLSKRMPPVEDQLDIGSCTAHAITTAMEYTQRRFCNLSRLYLYYMERAKEGTVKEDAGAQIRTGVKIAAKIGVCLESRWPYKTARFAHKPSKVAHRDASRRTIESYSRINDFHSFRFALMMNRPVIFGISLYESFMQWQYNMPMPRRDEQMIGGHAVLAVGYNERTKRVLCRNSWGKDWGRGGYFTLPYEYVERRDLSDDFWTVTA